MLATATDVAIESMKYEVRAPVAHGGALWDIVSKHAAAAIESSCSRSPLLIKHERDA